MRRVLKGMLNVAFRYPIRRRLTQEKQTSLHPCVAHRGFSGQAPENTLAAFRLALEQSYVQWIELDVHLSKDHIPVVIHDGTLKRTTNGKGNVREKTAEELKGLDAGSWFHPQFSTEGVPSLAEVLSLLAGRCQVNIELKGEASDHRLLVQKAIDVIHGLQLEKEIVITSFESKILLAVREYAPQIKFGLIVDESTNDLIARLQALGASLLSIHYRHLNSRILKQAEEAGISVMAWTVNVEGDLRRLAARKEPFQICTNYPNRWYKVMNKEGDKSP